MEQLIEKANEAFTTLEAAVAEENDLRYWEEIEKSVIQWNAMQNGLPDDLED